MGSQADVSMTREGALTIRFARTGKQIVLRLSPEDVGRIVGVSGPGLIATPSQETITPAELDELLSPARPSPPKSMWDHLVDEGALRSSEEAEPVGKGPDVPIEGDEEEKELLCRPRHWWACWLDCVQPPLPLHRIEQDGAKVHPSAHREDGQDMLPVP